MSVQATAPSKAHKHQHVELPFRKAFDFAMKSIKQRFLRSLITAGGVLLGIAFLASVLVGKAIAGPGVPATEIARANWQIVLSLLVCTVGITNSMLMSVSERFREIGTMKCLGALNEFVVKIFMIEAVLMGLIASTLGWVVGTVSILIVKFFVGVPKTAPAGTTWHGALSVGDLFGLPFGSFWMCIAIGAILTAVATFFPARQAASIPPAAALRSDV